MIDWIIENKEWALSGVAITIPVFIIGFFLKKDKVMNQKSGKNSVNIQAGGNVNYKVKK